MSWVPLPPGHFTGIDWSAPGAIEGMDPYLAWAEADRFVGYHIPGRDDPPEWLPIAIALRPGADVRQLVDASSSRWLQIPCTYLLIPKLRHCTARVSRRFFEHWRNGHPVRSLIERFELGLPVDEHTTALKAFCRRHEQPPAPSHRVSGTVLGVIDGGLAVANTAFRAAGGRTRVKHFWRQENAYGGPWPGSPDHHRVPLDPARAGPTPPDMGYGHALSGRAIDDAIARFTRNGLLDEDALYRRLQLWDLARSVSHGTHVCGLVTAPGGLLHPDLNDFASHCPIIAVQLDWANVRDTSGGALNVSVMDALHFIVSHCSDDARIVVNVSWGNLAGPHDGSSVLEAAMTELVERLGGRLQITVPAGNAYQSRTHANAALAPGESLELSWRVQPDDRTQSFLEIWLPERAQDVRITVAPPDRPAQAITLAAGESGMWVERPDVPVWSLIYPRTTALGTHGTCALLALEPTFSRHPRRALAPFGAWKITLVNRGNAPVVFDAYVERDDIALGMNTGARQSYFEDRHYDTQGNLDGWVDRPGNPTPIRRSGSFNSLATGPGTVSVGGTRAADTGPQPLARFARYSPRKPDPDAARPQRRGVKKVPDTLAPSDDNPALWGLRSTGSLSGSTARLVGTSAAAPQEARRLLNARR